MRLRYRSRLMARCGADKTGPWAAALLLGGVLSLILSAGQSGSTGQAAAPMNLRTEPGALRTTDCMEAPGERPHAVAGQEERSIHHGTADPGDRP